MDDKHLQQAGSYPDPAEVAQVGEHLTILVVDDEESARHGLMLALRDLGHRVLVAADGIEALEIYERVPIDVVLADWAMPRMSGVELCRELRTRARFVYFMFTTAHGDKAHLLEGMAAGADDYVSKPLDIDELEARLLAAKRVIGVHRALSMRNRALRRDSQRIFLTARVDALTGVRNRLALTEDLATLCSNVHRYVGQRYCAALCDVDHFKNYNDTFGHLEGDAVLRRIASVMTAQLRKGDEVYRFGGEEFFVILPHQTVETAKLAMDRVRRALEEAAIKHAPGMEWPVVTISVGISELAEDDTAEAWLRRTDDALYRAKRTGRNRVEIYGHD